MSNIFKKDNSDLLKSLKLYDIQKQQQQKGKSQKEVDKLGESIASKEKGKKHT